MAIDAAYPKPASLWDTHVFWDFCKAHELRMQRCSACGTIRFPPRPFCAECRRREATWEPVSGRGAVYTWTISYPPVLPAFADRVPYNSVVVRLEEGPFMVSNLVEWERDIQIPIGLRVEATFVDVDEELTIPQFRPMG
jgi:uncharacterized OB-fold protein